MLSRFILLAVKCADKRWHYLASYKIRNGRVVGYEYGKPNHLVIANLKAASYRTALVDFKYDTIKLFNSAPKTLNTFTSPIHVRNNLRTRTGTLHT